MGFRSGLQNYTIDAVTVSRREIEKSASIGVLNIECFYSISVWARTAIGLAREFAIFNLSDGFEADVGRFTDLLSGKNRVNFRLEK